MATVGSLVVNILGNTVRLEQSLYKSEARTAAWVQRIKGLFAGVAIAAGAALGIGSLGSGLTFGAELVVQAKQSQIAFEVMLGSATAARDMLADLKQYGAETPLQFQDLRSAAETLLGFNVAAEKILPTLKMLGDVSGGDAQKFQQLALVFAQTTAAGKLTGGDLLQYINSGFNPLMEISAKTGKSIAQLKKKMEAGAISAQMVAEAFESATGPGGRFFRMLERQGKEIGGLWSQLQDGVATLAMEIAGLLMEAFDFKSILATTGNFISRIVAFLQEYGENLRRLVVAGAAFTAGLTLASVAMLGIANATLIYATAQRAATAAGIIFQAVMNPANLIKIGAGLAGAAIAVGLMDRQLEAAGAAVPSLAKKTAGLKQQMEGVASATRDIGETARKDFPQLAGMLSTLKEWREVKADPIFGIPEKGRIDRRMNLFPEQVDDTTGKVRLLQQALSDVHDTAAQLGDVAVQRFSDQINRQIGEVTGINKAIADARRDLEITNRPASERSFKLQEFADKGATREQVHELEQLWNAQERAQSLMAEAKRQQDLQFEGSAQIRQLRDELDLLSGAATKTDIAMRELQRKGFAPDQIADLGGLMAQRDQLEQQQKLQERAKQIAEQSRTPQQKLADDLKELQQLRDQGLLTADVYDRAKAQAEENASGGAAAARTGVGTALAGSQEAVSSVLRAAGGGKHPQDKLVKKADEQIAALDKTNELLAEISRNGGIIVTDLT